MHVRRGDPDIAKCLALEGANVGHVFRNKEPAKFGV